MTTSTDTCVGYLVRFEEGLAPAMRFLTSYATRDPGLPHRLIVLRRGFRTKQAWMPFASAFNEYAAGYESKDVGDTGFDLGAYREVVDHELADFLCFLNTFSEVLCDGWLAHLHHALQIPGVGLVGATGSWESLRTGYPLPPRSPTPGLPRVLGSARTLLLHPATWRLERGRRSNYERFPNPHIRTNGFMLERSLALGLRWGSCPTREDCLRLESGRFGLSRQVEALGLRNVVVGCNGDTYGAEEWARSDTFRNHGQPNLLIADNRTREYEASPPETREFLGRMAWGAAYGGPA